MVGGLGQVLSDIAADSHGGPVERLSNIFGQRFVRWLLGVTSSHLTEDQRWAVTRVEEVLDQERLRHSHVSTPRAVLLFPLLHYRNDLDDTPLNDLRKRANKESQPQVFETSDEVLDALRRLAVADYGEMLLNADDPFGMPTSHARGPLQQRALEAVKADAKLPFAKDSEEYDQLFVERSSGGGGSFYLTSLPASILGVAFERARVAKGSSDLQALLEELPSTLASARAAFRGRAATSLGLAALSGVRLPPGGVLTFAGGQLREARESDPSNGIRRTFGGRRTQFTDEAGVLTEITDAGDVVMEVAVPFMATFRPRDSRPELYVRELAVDDTLTRKLSDARLSLLLAMGPSAPVTVPAWQRHIDLFAPDSYSFSRPEMFRVRTPTQLTEEQLATWQEWMDCVEAVSPKFLGTAPTRLLRAHAERHDLSDQLIDSVIVWEALFGMPQEATLRVTISLARLLEPAGELREALRSRASKIYRLRSQVVHGGDHKEADIPSAAQDAFEIGHRALQALFAKRLDLLELSSGERSRQLLLE